MSTESLADALPREQQRVRDLIPLYQEIGPAGTPAILLMRASLAQAERAAASGDVVAMLCAYEDLKGYSA